MSESRSDLRAWLCALCACAAGGAWLGACTGGTDTGNPLTDLDISDCKSHPSDDEGSARSSALTAAGPRYEGLTCFRAERDGELVELDVRNFSGGCAVRWHAHAQTRKDGVDVVLTNPSCAVAACGTCLYDGRFTVELEATGGDGGNGEIALIDHPCEGDEIDRGGWTLPEQDGKSTLACDFAVGADWYANGTNGCGKENLPCRAAGGLCQLGSGATACDEGLTCTEINQHDSRCLRQCSSQDDCAVPAAMRCEDGVCVL